MDEKDLKISGSGSASGGIYNDVKISGSGKIQGDIECSTLISSGSSEVEGNVKAKLIKSSGAFRIEGDITSEEIKSSGSFRVGGDVISREIKLSGSTEIEGAAVSKRIIVAGSAKVRGKLQAEEIEIKGHISVKEDCEAEEIKIKGGFGIDGLLNAGKIDIVIFGKSKVREIGGENISVKSGYGIGYGVIKIIKTIFSMPDYLEADVIEGDDLFLESTRSKIVRGNNVTIGHNCIIELVEYKDGIKILSGAKVQEQRKK